MTDKKSDSNSARTLPLLVKMMFGLFLFYSANAEKSFAEWPEYRGNQQRTSFQSQKIESSAWKPHWVDSRFTAPQPAWPKPARGSLWQKLTSIEPRVIDDRGYVPLIATDPVGVPHVIVASSANDRLISLDPRSGDIQWEFITRAPIRYAPSINKGVVYFGADDGFMRALKLNNGEILWEQRIGPDLPWIVGNGRVISPHPIRTSVVVKDNLVFANAGLYPSQGVYSVALNKTTGEIVWRRRVTKSPQGYLLADSSSRIVIPTGRSAPFVLHASTGRYLSDLRSPGGSFCMSTPDIDFAGPGNSASVFAYPKDNSKVLPLKGRVIAAGNGLIWLANEQQINCYESRTLQESLATNQPKWTVKCQGRKNLIVAGEAESLVLFVAVDDRIDVFDALTGRLDTSLSIPESDGIVQHLAVSRTDVGEFLIATTDAGTVYCWKGVASQSQNVEWSREKEQDHQAEIDESADSQVRHILDQLRSDVGLALILNDETGSHADAILNQSRLNLVLITKNTASRDRLRNRFHQQRKYGRRVSVWCIPETGPLPFADGIFNLVVDARMSLRPKSDVMRTLAAGTGVFAKNNSTTIEVKPSSTDVGSWRHQYANPENESDSRDSRIGTAETFRLQWFGGVGPNRMPDRHLRGAAPLATETTMVVHGDGRLIGVDPANGMERWELVLPEKSMRYVIPYDSGYSALTQDGAVLFTAAGKEIWKIDAFTGTTLQRIPLDREFQELQWGYLAETQGAVFATCMKPSAPRYSNDRAVLREDFISRDYNSARPLVCGRHLVRLDHDGNFIWKFKSPGAIVHGTISNSSNEGKVIFIEARSEEVRNHPTDRVNCEAILKDAHLVCLDSNTGKSVWEKPIQWDDARNMLYTQISSGLVSLVTSVSESGFATYHIRVLKLSDGAPVWNASHKHIRHGLGHGEQVHHPVALHQQSHGRTLLVVEPYLYDLQTGIRTTPDGTDGQWNFQRPGHSCGTLSGAGQCLFFRANNPTVLNLSKPKESAFTKLSPSRPSCWINIIPAGGRLLIPEGSASCVCSYPIQTSMAFVPIPKADASHELPFLEDILDIDVREESIGFLYGWQLNKQAAKETDVLPASGEIKLKSARPITFSNDEMVFDGKQWLSVDLAKPKLPEMPATISLEAVARVDEGNTTWTGLITALQDNGSYERGCALGIHQNRFFFAVASESTGRLTYLTAGTTVEAGEDYHVVGTYDGKLMKLYINGALVAVSTKQRGHLLADERSWLAVGAYKDDNELYPFKGRMREANLYRGPLSGDMIRKKWQELFQHKK